MSSKLGLLVVAANLALFSCAPKDEKVVPVTGAGVLQTLSASDSIKLISISFDREVEALHFLKAALNADYALQKKIDIQDIAANVKKISVVNGSDAKGAPLQDTLQATITMTEDGSSVKSVLIQDLFTKKIETKQISKTSSLKSLAKQISVTKQTNEDGTYKNEYYVEITSLEETNSIAGGNGSSNTFANFTIAWDGKADSLNTVSIISIAALGHNKYGVAKFIAKSASAAALTVNLKADCAELTGTVSLTSSSSPKKGQPANPVYNMTLTDSSILVDGSQMYQAAECASRPIVDLSKLF